MSRSYLRVIFAALLVVRKHGVGGFTIPSIRQKKCLNLYKELGEISTKPDDFIKAQIEKQGTDLLPTSDDMANSLGTDDDTAVENDIHSPAFGKRRDPRPFPLSMVSFVLS